jgi:peptide/nickel transport system substrate-binding protein
MVQELWPPKAESNHRHKDFQSYVGSFKEVRKIDDYTVEIETSTPFPILPDVISQWRMMSKA